MTRPFAFATIAFLLTGCDLDVPAPDCGLQPSAATADTAVAFQVDGRQVLQESGGEYPWMFYYYNAPIPQLQIVAGVSGPTNEDFQFLSLRLIQFHGAGAYPIFTSYQDHPSAFVTYSCARVRGEQWQGAGSIPDTVYVTAYDSVTSAISGTFHLKATGYRYGDVVNITDGLFQGFAPKTEFTDSPD